MNVEKYISDPSNINFIKIYGIPSYVKSLFDEDEILSEIYFTILKQWDKYDSAKASRNTFFSMCTRRMMGIKFNKECKYRNGNRVMSDQKLEFYGGTYEDSTAHQMAIDEYISQLDGTYADVAKLLVGRYMSVKEIAEELGVNDQTVRKFTAKVRARISEILGQN